MCSRSAHPTAASRLRLQETNESCSRRLSARFSKSNRMLSMQTHTDTHVSTLHLSPTNVLLSCKCCGQPQPDRSCQGAKPTFGSAALANTERQFSHTYTLELVQSVNDPRSLGSPACLDGGRKPVSPMNGAQPLSPTAAAPSCFTT